VTHTVQPEAQWGDDHGFVGRTTLGAEEQSESQNPILSAFREGRTCVCNDLVNDRHSVPWRRAAAGTGIRAVAVAPIRAQGEVWGALGVSANEPDFFQAQEINLLDEVALDISCALDNLEREAQRRQAEEAARAAEREWRTTFDAIGDAVCLIDLEGKILRANRTMNAFLGEEHGEIIGRHCFEVVHASACPVAECPLLRMKQSRHRESIILQRGTRWFEVVVDPLLNETGQLVGAVHIVVDITLRQRTENEKQELQTQLIQAQKMEAIGQLAGGVAHDFNNILTAILLHLSLLQDDAQLSTEVRTGLNELEAEAKRATNLTRQLLMFSRRQVLQVQPLDLNSLLGNLLKMLRRLIGEQIMLEFNGAPGDLWIEADPGMMEQMVMNLVVNARDAVSQDGRVTISTQDVELDATASQRNPEARAGRFVCLAVSDTGSGMADTTVSHIFEPFFTTKEAGKGTGMGLATVYGIVKQHQGWIEVETKLGRGSTFTIYLPAKSDVAVTSSEAAPVHSVRGGHETLLVVEDEGSVRSVLVALLRQLGYQVWETGSGPEALKTWEQLDGRVDLIISDVVMPGGITGLELSNRLLQQKPTLKAILMSGYSSEMAEHGMPQQTRVVFLQKPFEAVALANVVRDVLDGH